MIKISKEISNLFLKLSEDHQNLQFNVKNAAIAIAKDWELSGEQMTAALISCLTEFSDKSYIYASLIAYVSIHNIEIANLLLQNLKIEFDNLYSSNQWRKLKLLLRVFIDLVNLRVIQSESILDIYQALNSIISDRKQSLYFKDICAYLLMSSLPWSINILMKNHQSDFGKVWKVQENYLSKRVLEVSNHYKYFAILKDYGQYDQVTQLETLFKVCQNEIKNYSEGFKSKIIQNYSDSFAQDLQGVQSLKFEKVAIPKNIECGEYAWLYSVNFRVFHPDTLSDNGILNYALPEYYSFDRYVLYDQFQDLLVFFSHNHLKAIQYYSTVIQGPEFCPLYNPHQALTEILVAQILSQSTLEDLYSVVPGNCLNQTYYQSFVVDLCHHFKKNYPQVLGKVFYTLFELAPLLGVNAKKQFSNWFSFHVSNFDFRWNYKAWYEVCQKKQEEPIYGIFLQEILFKIQNLTYQERLTNALPKEVDLTPYLNQSLTPNYHFGPNPQTNMPSLDQDEQLLNVYLSEQFKSKGSFDDYVHKALEIVALKSLNEKYQIQDIEGEQPGTAYARWVLIEFVLEMGNKSVSHLVNSIEKTLPLLKTFCAADSDNTISQRQAQVQVVQSIQNYWANNSFFFKIAVLKFIQNGLVLPSSVVSWVLSRTDLLSRFFIQELLQSIVYFSYTNTVRSNSQMETEDAQDATHLTSLLLEIVQGLNENTPAAPYSQELLIAFCCNNKKLLKQNIDGLQQYLEEKNLKEIIEILN